MRLTFYHQRLFESCTGKEVYWAQKHTASNYNFYGIIAYNASLMGRHHGGILGVNWREATYTQKADMVTVQPNLLGGHWTPGYMIFAFSFWSHNRSFDGSYLD